MRFNKKIIISFVLIAAIGAAEIFGILICGNMIPDYKNQIFEESGSDSTRLMFINDEDSSRFYPWLEYDKESCISYEKYITDCCDNLLKASDYNDNYQAEVVEDIIAYLRAEAEKNGGDFDANNKSQKDLKSVYSSICSEQKNKLNHMIGFINRTFDYVRCAPEKTDFADSALIDKSIGILYIEGFKYIGTDNAGHIMDLVMGLTDYSVKFYRLREETGKVFSSSDITRKSEKIIDDLDYAIPYIEKYYTSSYVKNYEEDYNDSDGVRLNDDAEYEENSEEPFLADEDDNALFDYLINISMSGVGCDLSMPDTDGYININFYEYENITDKAEENYCTFVFYLEIPHYADEYNVFSSGDELIIVLSSDSRKNSTILYYSLSADRITGIGTGSA